MHEKIHLVESISWWPYQGASQALSLESQAPIPTTTSIWNIQIAGHVKMY
jgi:hypothetical protein